jgi:hypothetical protein
MLWEEGVWLEHNEELQRHLTDRAFGVSTTVLGSLNIKKPAVSGRKLQKLPDAS